MNTPIITLETKDSGARQEFTTGSRRDAREGKGRYDLISPFAERRLALVNERGAGKYGDRNWEMGQPLSRYLDSAKRHIRDYFAGDRSEDHLGQALWNLHAAVHTEEMVVAGVLPRELYDLPDYSPKVVRGENHRQVVDAAPGESDDLALSEPDRALCEECDGPVEPGGWQFCDTCLSDEEEEWCRASSCSN